MKKITLMVALLGSVYFANAQVGIGTPEPSRSSMLDIVADDKGVLIPRVNLTDSETALSALAQDESLLVYNLATVTGEKAVLPGFYYWIPLNGSVPAHWERVVNQAQLDQVLTTQSSDLTKIKELLKAAYGSNNLDASPASAAHGGMVYTPADGSTPAKFEFVKLNAANTAYEKVDITSVITDLINAKESKTTILQYPASSGKFYYISEEAILENNNAVPTSPFVQAEGVDSASLLTGVVLIDVPASVSRNFQTILSQTTTILKAGQTDQFYTVQEYIQYLIDSTALQDNVMTYVPGTGSDSKAILASSSFTYTPAGGTITTVAFADLVKANETVTQITKTETGTVAVGDVVITYNYFNEAQPDNTLAPQETIALTADLVTLINGNTEIKNAIQNVLNKGGNVYFTTTIVTEDTSSGQLEIPANSFYTINDSGVKVEINVPVNINQLITAITNASANQKNILKQQLGDNLTTNNTSVFTGDTIRIDGVVHYIYKGNFVTTVNANTANTTGFNLDKSSSKILSLDLRYASGIVANTTDLSVVDLKVSFRIGTGKMYQILGTADVPAEVVVEFASTVVPAGVIN